MKRPLLNVLALFSMMLLAGFSASAQGTYTLCSIPGDITTDSTGTLYDTGGPLGQYQNNENCTLLIAPPCATSITLEFDSFATESGFDFFRVYDGQTVAAPQLLNAAGQVIPTPVTCTSGYMLIIWRTDVSVVYDGFVAHWTSVIAPSVAPVAGATVSDFTPPLGINVQFTDTSQGGPTTWLWDFGDGDTARSQNPLHAYSAPGTYTVTFVAFSCTESDTVTFTVNVQAAPQIEVDPDSIVANVFCGDSAAFPMIVTNIAGGELFWTADADVNTGLPVNILVMKYGTDQFVEYPRTLAAIDSFFTNYVMTQTATTDPGLLNALLVGKNVLLIPEQEQGDPAVWANLTTTIQRFLNNGGSVIWLGAYSSQADCIFGTGVFSGTFDSDATQSTISVVDPSHPIVAGVPATFTAPSATYVMNLTNANKQTLVLDQAADVVSWMEYGSGKAIFIAFDYFAANWQAKKILANAVQWGGINGLPTWITLNPLNDTLNAGDTTNVVVSFQTTGLPAGTYTAYIPVVSNDPNNQVVLVPCTLTITGDPIVALSDSCVDFGDVMQHRLANETFEVINNGCDTLFVNTITATGTGFSIISANFNYLIPGASGVVTVGFQSATVGSFSGTVSIPNNDVDTTVCLNATTYPAPDVNPNPGGLTASLRACGDDTTQTFEIQNLGGSDLYYSLGALPVWATANISGDTIAASASQTITITFNSGTLLGGTYNAVLNITSNDPLSPIVPVNLELNVDFNPCMDYTFTSNTCTGETNFNSTAINAPNTYSWDFGDGSPLATTANPTHFYINNGTYTVELIACNASGCDTVTQTVNAIITGPQATSCYPVTQAYCCGIGPTTVQFASINNNSNDAIDGYANYTCSDTTTLVPGDTYAFNVTTGFTYAENVLAWCDWNGDNTLDPVGELVFSDAGQGVLTFHVGTFTVPANASLNKPLRFRVASEYDQNPTPTPCLDLQFGQVEDYSVIVRYSGTVGIKDQSAINIPFSVFPNPYAGSTRIEYNLDGSSKVLVEVYNTIGERVQSFCSNELQAAGKHFYNFEGTTPGVYSVRLTVDGQSVIKKVVKL